MGTCLLQGQQRARIWGGGLPAVFFFSRGGVRNLTKAKSKLKKAHNIIDTRESSSLGSQPRHTLIVTTY